MKRVLIWVIVLALFMAACAPTATEPPESSVTQEPTAAIAAPDPKPAQLLVDADPQGSLTSSLGWKQPDDLRVTLATQMQKAISEIPIDPQEGILP